MNYSDTCHAERHPSCAHVRYVLTSRSVHTARDQLLAVYVNEIQRDPDLDQRPQLLDEIRSQIMQDTPSSRPGSLQQDDEDMEEVVQKDRCLCGEWERTWRFRRLSTNRRPPKFNTLVRAASSGPDFVENAFDPTQSVECSEHGADSTLSTSWSNVQTGLSYFLEFPEVSVSSHIIIDVN